MSEDDPVVLVVEDEPSLVEIYAHWLDDDYAVLTAQCGEQALSMADTADLMVLDRLMPGMSGDEVIDAVRDRDLDCLIVMATAVEPGVDLIAMGADSYLTKPVDRDELLATVSHVLDRRQYAEREREFFRLVSKRAALANRNERSVQETEEFAELESRIESLRDRLDKQIGGIDDLDLVALLKNSNT